MAGFALDALCRLARHMGAGSVARDLADRALANGSGWVNKESLCRGMGEGVWRDEELAWMRGAYMYGSSIYSS